MKDEEEKEWVLLLETCVERAMPHQHRPSTMTGVTASQGPGPEEEKGSKNIKS